MEKRERTKNQKNLIFGIFMLVLFVVWTVLVKMVDVEPIGPNGSSVGFATLNGFVHELLGVHMALYDITDWLSIIPLLFIFAFAVLGVVQLVKRKSIFKVDNSILILGGFYAVVMAVFVMFEFLAVNYRPVLINGVLEASYPSSTTLLVMCVLPTTVMQLKSRIKNQMCGNAVAVFLYIFTVFMITARLISGVHWFTDIIGGAVFSAGLVMIYYSLTKLCAK